MQSPIFIVGCPRSGTSLVRDLLSSHPTLSFPFETHFIPAIHAVHGDPADSPAARRLAEHILGHWRVKDWNLDLVPSDLEHHRSFAGLLGDVYGAWARREGKPRWGDKTPAYVLHIPLLHDLYPGARIVHVYRDGRDVALSLRSVPFGAPNSYSAALFWVRMVSAGRTAGAALPPDAYREIRYEDLLASPEPTLRELCSFLGEDFDERLLRTTQVMPARGTLAWKRRSRSKSGRGIEASNQGKWRTEMSDLERRAFESVGGELLRELDYPTGEDRYTPGLPRRFIWRLQGKLRAALWRVRYPRTTYRDFRERLRSVRARAFNRAAAARASGSEPAPGS